MGKAEDWVLLAYRLPRVPSTPRSAVWRKLKRLGVAWLGDGLVALPADPRTREQLEWVAEEVTEHGGEAMLWQSRPLDAGARSVVRSRMTAAAPADATPCDMRGAALGHHHGRCSFEPALTSFGLDADPALEEIGHIVHEADLADERYDAPAAAGLDVLIRGLTLTSDSDHDTLTVTHPLFHRLYEHTRRPLLTGRPPAQPALPPACSPL